MASIRVVGHLLTATVIVSWILPASLLVPMSPATNKRCRHKHLCQTSIFKPCLNNGTCLVDSITCTTWCLCQQNFTGGRCESATIELEETICGTSGQTCAYGLCDNSTSGGYSCECYEGWTGPSCNIKESHSKRTSFLLPFDGFPAEMSRVFTPTRLSPSPMFNPPFIIPPLNPEETDNKNQSAQVEITGYEPMFNVCLDTYEMRQLEERQCSKYIKTITCSYGVCKKDVVVNGNSKSFQFHCECDPGAFGLLCDRRCCLDCGVHGKCDVIDDDDGNLTEVCNCRYSYTGELCEIFVPEPVRVEVHEATWYLWIVGLCAITFIALITAGVVAPYLMWKHRVILIMKIVHYFQPYEDDDEKDYDAFVSYRADEIDERFVVQVLYPKLEKELGFKLCLHFRDFVPGEVIANNIINAVEGSRRTILILTPRYVQSEFTKFEYQKAQSEMLKRKHRIIPIMLEDITDLKSSLDDNLKGIIGSVTYLEWPEVDCPKKMDKFWKRLQLSMPKKKDSDSFQMPTTDKTNSSSLSTSLPMIKSSTFDKSVTESEISSKTTRTPRRFVRSMAPDVTSSDYIKSSDTVRQCDGDGGNVYVEIGDIDFSVCEMIRPLSEDDELALTLESDGSTDTPNNTEEELKSETITESDGYTIASRNYELPVNEYTTC